MQREKVINQLLYVPFNHDYSVDETIKRVLTEEEFFNKCFFMPDFNKEITEILSDSSEEIVAFEIDLTKDEIIEKYSERIEKEKAFYEWINTNQKDIYCIKGDAGTGKSTFLHYLKNKYPNDENNIKWKILDIKKIDTFVSALYYRINIPEFNNLYYKSIACIIQNMVEDLFTFQNDGKIDFINSA